MSRALALLATGVLAAGASLASAAASVLHVEIRTASGKPLHWAKGKIPVTFVINDQGSADLPQDASEDLAIRRGFRAWEDVTTSAIRFQEITTPAQRARTDWASDDIRLVLFDEVNSSGFFPPGSGIIAITPLQFSPSSGVILDADILFNGQLGSPFSTNLGNNSFDVQTTATHEVGHLIGLDHTGLLAATMAPFQSAQQFHGRTLSLDDALGATALYPEKGLALGRIEGFVKRAADETPVSGAHVWARSALDGRLATATTSAADGSYALDGVPAGSWRVVAGPLDGPVSSGEILPSSTAPLETDFQPAAGDPIALGAGETVAAPTVFVPPDAALNVLGPAVVRTMHPGETKIVGLTGVGLAGATVSVPDGGASFLIAGFAPNFSIQASPATPPGIYDLWVTAAAGGAVADGNGFLEVLPLAPTITAIQPGAASTAGGVPVTIDGANLPAAPVVAFGDLEAASTEGISSARIRATTPAAAAKTVDLVVMNEAGEEARAVAGFLFANGTSPIVATVFPDSGSTAGGQTVRLGGSGFDPGAAVRVGGVAPTSVVVVSATRIDLVTPALAPGAHDVKVTNPGAPPLDGVLVEAFTAIAGADPTIAVVVPPYVASVGGSTVSVMGTGFVDGASVELFVDPLTGLGGVPATSATFVSDTELSVTVPAGPLGDVAIVVRNPDQHVAVATGLLESQPAFTGAGRLFGAIDPGGDIDSFHFDGIAGTKVNVTLAAKGKNGIPAPAILLENEAGDDLLSTDPAHPAFDPAFTLSKTKRAQVRNFVLPVSERILVRLSGIGGATGDYACTLRETLPKEARRVKFATKPPVSVGPDQAFLSVVAKAGTLVSGSIRGKKPLLPELAALDGPAGSILGDPEVAASIQVSPKGDRISFKKVPLGLFGEWQLGFGAAGGTSGTIAGSLSLRPPKSTTKPIKE